MSGSIFFGRMKKYLIIVVSSFVLLSCRKLNLCDDKELGFNRQQNSQIKLQTNGYYYGDLLGNNPENPGIHFFTTMVIIFMNIKDH